MLPASYNVTLTRQRTSVAQTEISTCSCSYDTVARRPQRSHVLRGGWVAIKRARGNTRQGLLETRTRAVALEAALTPAFTVGSAVVAALLGFSIWKFTTYSQLEYVTASMLSRWVPRDGNGARVIQLGGGTRELYYYPKNTLQVTVVGEGVNKGLIEQAGLQAAVPTIAKVQSPANLGFSAPASVDAIVSMGCMASMTPVQYQMFLQEAVRVLKPSCPLIFIEKVPGGLPLRRVGSPAPVLGMDALEMLRQKGGFQEVQWDIALGSQDPHAVGVALRAEGGSPQLTGKKADVEEGRILRSKARVKDTKKGFSHKG